MKRFQKQKKKKIEIERERGGGGWKEDVGGVGQILACALSGSS